MNPELVKLNQVVYQKGMVDGYNLGYEQGAVFGVKVTLDQLGIEASEKLRGGGGNGNPMAFYREFKQKYSLN